MKITQSPYFHQVTDIRINFVIKITDIGKSYGVTQQAISKQLLTDPECIDAGMSGALARIEYWKKDQGKMIDILRGGDSTLMKGSGSPGRITGNKIVGGSEIIPSTK